MGTEQLNDKPIGSTRRRLRVVTVGGGIAGINAAHRFGSQADIEFQAYEKEAELGGVWFSNNYPGLKCDIPAHAFYFSWEPWHTSSTFFASRDEILAYIQHTLDKHDLRRFFKTRCECISALWQPVKHKWRLTFRRTDADGAETEFEDDADVFILAWGHLSNQRWPEIPGLLDTYKGKIIHSARWDTSYPVEGKNIAIIGNGASAVQLVPALQPKVASLDNYFRTKTWITPSPLPDGASNKKYSQEELESWQKDPQKLFDERKALEKMFHLRFRGFRIGTPEQKGYRDRTMQQLEDKIKDDALRKKLTPDFAVGCRRPTPGPDTLVALQAQNVELIDTAITAATEKGLKTADGKERDYDAIICATGFNIIHRPRTRIIGRGGIELGDVWSKSPELYLGCGVHGFPNLFLISGPGGIPLGSHYNSVELSTRYIGLFLERLQERNLLSVEPSLEAQRDYNLWLQHASSKMAWTDTCRSWFNGGNGSVCLVFPGSPQGYAEATKTLADGDFIWASAEPNRFAWLGNGFTAREFTEEPDADIVPFLGTRAGDVIGQS